MVENMPPPHPVEPSREKAGWRHTSSNNVRLPGHCSGFISSGDSGTPISRRVYTVPGKRALCGAAEEGPSRALQDPVIKFLVSRM